MRKFSLRSIVCISLIAILLALILFAGINRKEIISIAVIMLFLLIFTYIFKTDGPKTLKVIIILFTFFGLPLFTLLYLGTFGFITGIWSVIIHCIISIIFGLTFLFLIIQLDYVEISH